MISLMSLILQSDPFPCLPELTRSEGVDVGVDGVVLIGAASAWNFGFVVRILSSKYRNSSSGAWKKLKGPI